MSSEEEEYLGFKKKPSIRSRIINKVLKRIEREINIFTSTPNKGKSIMDISFPNCYEEVSKTYLQADTDSGYMSHHQESNSDNHSSKVSNILRGENLFISEDALLEKPQSIKKNQQTDSVYEEFSNVYYLNHIIDTSVSTTKTSYSGLEDTDTSFQSETSPVLGMQQPIVVEDYKLKPLFFNENDNEEKMDAAGDKPNIHHNIVQSDVSCFNGISEQTNTNLLVNENIEGETLYFNVLQSEKVCENRNSFEILTSSLQANDSHLYFNGILHENQNIELIDGNQIQILQNNQTNFNFNGILQENKTFGIANESLPNFFTINNQQTNNSNQQTDYLINPNHQTSDNSTKRNKQISSKNKFKYSFETNSAPQFADENNINILNIENPILRKPNSQSKRKRSTSETPQKRLKAPCISEGSPDLFSDEETPTVEEEIVVKTEAFVPQENYIDSNDHKLLKRLNKTLSGVLPPPSFTTTHLSVEEMMEKIKENEQYFWDKDSSDKSKHETLLINTDLQNSVNKDWPEVLTNRYHGIHYNCSKLSEDLESLYMKYSQRYVGAETQSSCTVFDNLMSSPSKRKANRLRWTAKSPGRRLSHLARRRITFSSANLQAGTSRQVMMDAKRFELLSRKPSPRKGKSPRKTPRKSPRKTIRTPSSSTKKRHSLRFTVLNQEEEKAGPSTSSLRASATKRALFQSPEKLCASKVSKTVIPSKSCNMSLSPWKKKNTPKRALFNSPIKNSPSKTDSNKRKRLDCEEGHPSKISRSLSVIETSESSLGVSKLQRVRSDSRLVLSQTNELSAHHKKKLQWAVYEALRGQNITVSHPQFKQFASVLARVTRRLLPNLSSGPKPEVGTSERMLRVAKQHVFAVTKGKTVDEIIQNYESSRVKSVKPSGYVSKQEGSKMDISQARNIKDNVFQDKANTLNSFEKSTTKNRPVVHKVENRIERVKKIINFDDDSSLSSFR